MNGLYDCVIICNKQMCILNSMSLGCLDSLKGVSALKPQFCPDLISPTVGKDALSEQCYQERHLKPHVSERKRS